MRLNESRQQHLPLQIDDLCFVADERQHAVIGSYIRYGTCL